MALTQSDIDVEIKDLQDAYDKAVAGGAPLRHHPSRDYPPYRSCCATPSSRWSPSTAVTPQTVELSVWCSASPTSPSTTAT